MKVSIINNINKYGKNDIIVLFINEENVKNISGMKFSGSEFIDGFDLSHFTAKSSELYFLKPLNKPGVLLCGTGSIKKYNDENLRNSSSAAVRFCISKKMKKISFIVPDINNKKETDILKLIAEGATLSNYAFSRKDIWITLQQPVPQNCGRVGRQPPTDRSGDD